MFDFLKRQLFGQPEPETTITLPEPVDPPPEFDAAEAAKQAAAAQVKQAAYLLEYYRAEVWSRVQRAVGNGGTSITFGFRNVHPHCYHPYTTLAQQRVVAAALLQDYQAKGYVCQTEEQYDVKSAVSYTTVRICWEQPDVSA